MPLLLLLGTLSLFAWISTQRTPTVEGTPVTPIDPNDPHNVLAEVEPELAGDVRSFLTDARAMGKPCYAYYGLRSVKEEQKAIDSGNSSLTDPHNSLHVADSDGLANAVDVWPEGLPFSADVSAREQLISLEPIMARYGLVNLPRIGDFGHLQRAT